MKNQFVTYEIALVLKELGFDEKCFALYDAYQDNKLVYLNEDGRNAAGLILTNASMDYSCLAPLWQQAIDWCDSKGLLVGTIVVDNLYKSTINKINYETELFHSRNESIKRAIEFAISYLQDNKT